MFVQQSYKNIVKININNLTKINNNQLYFTCKSELQCCNKILRCQFLKRYLIILMIFYKQLNSYLKLFCVKQILQINIFTLHLRKIYNLQLLIKQNHCKILNFLIIYLHSQDKKKKSREKETNNNQINIQKILCVNYLITILQLVILQLNTSYQIVIQLINCNIILNTSYQLNKIQKNNQIKFLQNYTIFSYLFWFFFTFFLFTLIMQYKKIKNKLL
eukprot:TRINITY_DN1276_c1_g1_i2.p2 TRINITY_DN1276_c1_g1~~TRINITY_DN1276_c1_g1_i2.p2  ORF type:complete len:217 (+),score=-8.42 TRINITY_DN1276_c1_g1_i2:250-900(+)